MQHRRIKGILVYIFTFHSTSIFKVDPDNVPYWILYTPEQNHEKGHIFVDAQMSCKDASQFCGEKFRVSVTLRFWKCLDLILKILGTTCNSWKRALAAPVVKVDTPTISLHRSHPIQWHLALVWQHAMAIYQLGWPLSYSRHTIQLSWAGRWWQVSKCEVR